MNSSAGVRSTWWVHSVIIVLAALALHVPFLNQAIQLDDHNYLEAAQYAQQHPLHPHHASYVFLGEKVDMQGHPHPPGNAWILALLVFVAGGIRPVLFHAAYLVFTVGAALGVYALARRFTARPLPATLLVLVTPAWVVDGNSFMSDIPFLAFTMGAMACFVYGVDLKRARLLLAAGMLLAAAALTAYQAIFFVPIFWSYLWLTKFRRPDAWLLPLVAAFVIAAFQLFERASTGATPASVLVGHFGTYALQTLSTKLQNAAALTAHLGWVMSPLLVWLAFRRLPAWGFVIAAGAAFGGMFVDPHPVFWISFATGVAVLLYSTQRVYSSVEGGERFLGLWLMLFFAASLVVFFAGAARYLLPVTAPLAFLLVRALHARPRWLWGAMAVHAAFSLALSVVNYQHWDGYRRFAHSQTAVMQPAPGGNIWVNGEWGFRYYMERAGAQPVLRGQTLQPGDVIVTSALGYPVPVARGGLEFQTVAQHTVTSPMPLRLMGLDARSAYTTNAFGLRPFGIGTGPIDLIRLEQVSERLPRLSRLPMNAPEAEEQIIRGIYSLEAGNWRWMSGEAVLRLKPPVGGGALRVRVQLTIPDVVPGRVLSIALNGVRLSEFRLSEGAHELRTGAVTLPAGSAAATVTLHVDQTLSPPADERELGLILHEVTLEPAR